MTRSFWTQFAALVLASYAVLFGLRAWLGPAVVHPLAPYVLGGLLAVTLLTYWLTARFVSRSADNFLGAYFGGVVLRLMLSLVIVLVYFYRGGAHEGRGTWAFLGVFFVSYFLGAGFEIWAIFSNLRPFSKKQVPEE
ncbi:hypothetical protein FNT36_07960 [Hymenobacter setariae]|uniref:Uncharacterized protein n=1 Tax=Hymenobacter setariae TaxID=2594794 RepID=A0A558BXY0_9BACT|nr:hypothetical protein [Hymenobacter setariae]TVT41375.1 hypothetical protein FNT36_07960 [Hymenobacter setariae]